MREKNTIHSNDANTVRKIRIEFSEISQTTRCLAERNLIFNVGTVIVILFFFFKLFLLYYQRIAFRPRSHHWLQYRHSAGRNGTGYKYVGNKTLHESWNIWLCRRCLRWIQVKKNPITFLIKNRRNFPRNEHSNLHSYCTRCKFN